ncbi:MAG: hypothetical protein AAB415_03320 [Patescibacteria group bacterium]
MAMRYNTKQVVCIHIQDADGQMARGCFGETVVGRNFVDKLQSFMMAEGIRTVVSGGWGGSSFKGFFTADDAAKITTWLKEKGAVEVEYKEIRGCTPARYA